MFGLFVLHNPLIIALTVGLESTHLDVIIILIITRFVYYIYNYRTKSEGFLYNEFSFHGMLR